MKKPNAGENQSFAMFAGAVLFATKKRAKKQMHLCTDAITDRRPVDKFE
jgi:hypothetical protein